MRVGVLGGTFDPVHLGHLTLAEEARVQLNLDYVLFMPAGQPWLKDAQQLSSANDRLQMVRLAVASNPDFRVSVDEIERSGPTYTIDTLKVLRNNLGPETELFFILGLDAMEHFSRWKEPESLLELCQWAVVERPGHQGFDLAGFGSKYPGSTGKINLLSMPLMGISASEVRRRAKAGMSLRYYLPEGVAEYIQEQQLYGQYVLSGWNEDETAPSGLERLLEVALERGALDATEWVGPYDDEKLGFHKIAKNYYYPGWWEPGPNLSFYVGQDAWDSLPAAYKEVFQTATREAAAVMQAQYDVRNAPALKRILEAGVTLRPFSDDIMFGARAATQQILEEQAAADPAYAKLYKQWSAARKDMFSWFSTSELAYAKYAFPSGA